MKRPVTSERKMSEHYSLCSSKERHITKDYKSLVLSLFKSICEDRHTFWRQYSRRDKTIFGELVLIVEYKDKFSQNLTAKSFSDLRLIFLLSQALNQFTQILESGPFAEVL